MPQTTEVPGAEALQQHVVQDEADFRAALAEYVFPEEETANVKQRIDTAAALYRSLEVKETGGV